MRIFICPIAIAYSMGQIIKSFCVCPCMCVCVLVCLTVLLSVSLWRLVTRPSSVSPTVLLIAVSTSSSAVDTWWYVTLTSSRSPVRTECHGNGRPIHCIAVRTLDSGFVDYLLCVVPVIRTALCVWCLLYGHSTLGLWTASCVQCLLYGHSTLGPWTACCMQCLLYGHSTLGLWTACCVQCLLYRHDSGSVL